MTSRRSTKAATCGQVESVLKTPLNCKCKLETNQPLSASHVCLEPKAPWSPENPPLQNVAKHDYQLIVPGMDRTDDAKLTWSNPYMLVQLSSRQFQKPYVGMAR
jgi:hypothetical protein